MSTNMPPDQHGRIIGIYRLPEAAELVTVVESGEAAETMLAILRE